jgi:hypothetical protein
MTTVEETTTTVWGVEDETFDEAQLAAVAFLARYSGRTLDAYRHDLRAFFQWATDKQLIVLKATRPYIELYRAAMEERGLAASTIDRRLSTVCGIYRFAHIDGRIAANPAQYVRRPKVQPSEGRGMDRAELGTFLFTAERFDRDHAALAVLLGLNGLRVSEACGTNIGPRAATRPLDAAHPWQGQQASHDPACASEREDHRSGGWRAPRRPDPAPQGRATFGSSHRASVDPFDRQAGGSRSGPSAHAPRRVHHGRARRRSTPTRRTDRRPPRRPAHDDHLRPTKRELRPARRLRRRRVRRRRVTPPTHQAALSPRVWVQRTARSGTFVWDMGPAVPTAGDMLGCRQTGVRRSRSASAGDEPGPVALDHHTIGGCMVGEGQFDGLDGGRLVGGGCTGQQVTDQGH